MVWRSVGECPREAAAVRTPGTALGAEQPLDQDDREFLMPFLSDVAEGRWMGCRRSRYQPERGVRGALQSAFAVAGAEASDPPDELARLHCQFEP